MAKLRLLEDINEDDLSYEELQALKNMPEGGGVVSCKVVPFKDLSDEDLEMMWNFDGNNHEFLLSIRPDWVRRCHPEMVN